MNDQPKGRIGPHTGREAELLLSGHKPVAMFANINIESPPGQIALLEQAVAQGRLCKAFVASAIAHRTFYCQPHEQEQMQELIGIYHKLDSQTPAGATAMAIPLEDHLRIGTLLGYNKEDIELFLAHQRSRMAVRENITPPLKPS